MPYVPIAQDFTTTTAFEALTVPALKSLARLVSDSPPMRKADLVKLLAEALQDETQVRKFYEEATELNQAAIREATHAADGRLDVGRFRAKYGAAPTSGSGANPSVLSLFMADGHQLPADLRQLLSRFVPQPEAAALATVDELPEVVEQEYVLWEFDGTTYVRRQSVVQIPVRVLETEQAARHDIHAVLRLVDAGKVAVSATTRKPGQATLKAVAGVLHSGDFYTGLEEDPEAPEETDDLHLKSFAWPMIFQAAGLVEVSGSRLKVAAAGRKAAAAPAHEALRTAWNKWLRTTLLDELSRVNAIRGQGGKGKTKLTAVAGRRQKIAAALAECPVGRWITIDAFFRYMQAAAHDFEVTRDPWTLYIDSPFYGSLGDNSYGWSVLPGRYVMAVLFEYAATLGLVDVAYIPPARARSDFRDMWGTDDLSYLSRYDGLSHVRLNRLGAWILGRANRYEPEAPASTQKLKVLPNLDIAVTGQPLPPGDALFLERFAERSSEAVWRLSAPRCLAAVEDGLALSELQEFLGARNGGPLPQPVEVFLNDLAGRAGRLRDLGAARLVECVDAHTAQLLANDRRLRSLCWIAGDRHLVFRADDEAAVRRGLRELGYALPPAGGKS